MNDAIETALAKLPVFEAGEVWLAGAGPGDPAMLTLQALARSRHGGRRRP